MDVIDNVLFPNRIKKIGIFVQKNEVLQENMAGGSVKTERVISTIE